MPRGKGRPVGSHNFSMSKILNIIEDILAGHRTTDVALRNGISLTSVTTMKKKYLAVTISMAIKPEHEHIKKLLDLRKKNGH